jgi:serine/threonine-protein kinase
VIKSEPLSPGTVIDHTYVVKDVLGSGGVATVYRVERMFGEKGDLALKLLENTANLDLERFQRERFILERVESRHVVRLLDFGRPTGGNPYLVLELIPGGSLGSWMNDNRKTSEQVAAWIIDQAICGLLATQIVHRDLKPENFLIAPGRKGDIRWLPGDVDLGATIKVTDFGLAKDHAQGVALTATNIIMGTPRYMSPEQCKSTKKVTISTDIYALGVILYELVAGKVPFDSPDLYELLKMQMECKPEIPDHWSPLFGRIVRRCLEKDPNRRYRSFSGLQAELQAVYHREAPSSFWRRILANPFSRTRPS